MSQAVGTFYTIAKVPMRLYYDSDRAAKKNTLQSGWVQQTGDYRIVNVRWTNANGDVLQTKPSSGGIALYAIKDISDSYTIGWVRDDDNVKKGEITSIPSAITTEDASFKVIFTKMPGSTYTLKMVTNGVTWGSYVNSDASIAWDSLSQTHTFNATNKAKIYSAMPNSVNATATVTLETTYQGKSLGTDTKTMQVSIPSSIKPSFASTPVRTITGAVGGKNYVGLTSLKVTVPSINIPSGAKITSTIIDIGGQRSGNLAVGGSFTRTFNSPGTIPVSVTSTDSRGRSAVYSTTYTVLEAKNISIDSFTAIRNGTTGIKITANGQYMSQIDGTPKYTITKSIRGKNSWSSVATGNVTVSNGRYTISVTQTSGFTATSAYDLRLVVSGTSTSATGTSVVGTEAVPISFGKHGSGVGTMFDNSNSASLQVGSGGIRSEGPLRAKTFDIIDDRSLNPGPYTSGSSNRGLSVHFKQSSAIGVPDTGTYSTLFDVQPWNEKSGGNHQQLALNSKGELYGRMGTSSWSGWRKFAFTSDIPSIPSIPKAYAPTSGGSGNNRWIKFPSGHQICWGSTTTTGSSKAVTLPRAFTATPMITVTGHHSTHSPSTTLSAASKSTATFYIVDGRNGGLWGGSYTSGMTATLRYIAVGMG